MRKLSPLAIALLLFSPVAQGADEPPTSRAPPTPSPSPKPIVVPLPAEDRQAPRIWATPAAQTALDAGDAAFAAKDYRAAIRSYQDAVLADRRSAEALVKLGNAEGHLGYDTEAIEQYQRALGLDPTSAPALQGLAEARTRMVARQKPLPAGPDAPVDVEAARRHYAAGVELLNKRQLAPALAELDQSLAARPAYAVAFVARGSAHLALGHTSDAWADYAAARATAPGLAAPIFGLAEVARAQGQLGQAAALYREFANSTASDATDELKAYARRSADELSKR